MKIKFKIHPLTYAFIFLSLITGYFKYIIYLMTLIYIHELGHITAGIILNWNIKKVVICPFGGMTYFDELQNRKMIEEFIIVILGPIYQILLYLILKVLGLATPLLADINIFLLIFNMLPVFPLDGSKLVLLFLQKIFSFYNSYIILILISIITLFSLTFIYHSFLYLILYIFLLFQIYLLNKQRKELFHKFVLERILYPFNFKKNKIINNKKNMKREYNHYFYYQNKLINEKNFLRLFL